MAFFAEDVHLLARYSFLLISWDRLTSFCVIRTCSSFIFCSASVDGRVFVWKINEGPDDEDKPQIFGKAVIAVQIVGQEESIHPRVCWHPHKQVINGFVIYVIK